MSEIVTLHHNEPMTTSLAIAEGVEMDHKSVIQLVRKYIEDLSEFGSLAFEMRVMRKDGRGGEAGEVAFLNEQQATLLVTFMRNSPIVIEFKKALVRAFFEMRDQLRLTAPANPPFLTSNLSHGADLAVAADRTFRGFLRSAKSSGLTLPQALRIANHQTKLRTGMDMLHELDVDPDQMATVIAENDPKIEDDPLYIALAAWAETAQPGCYYSMNAILSEAVGGDISRIAGKAGPHLRALGFKHRRMRLPTGNPANLWSRG